VEAEQQQTLPGSNMARSRAVEQGDIAIQGWAGRRR